MMKPIEPQGHLGKRNKISEYYDISQNTTVHINPWLVNTRISRYHATVPIFSSIRHILRSGASFEWRGRGHEVSLGLLS